MISAGNPLDEMCIRDRYKQAFEAFTEENRRRKAQTATTEKLLKEFLKDQEEPKSDSDHPEINNSYTAWLISELDNYKKK